MNGMDSKLEFMHTAETAGNSNVNAEASFGAQLPSDCPQVEKCCL